MHSGGQAGGGGDSVQAFNVFSFCSLTWSTGDIPVLQMSPVSTWPILAIVSVHMGASPVECRRGSPEFPAADG